MLPTCGRCPSPGRVRGHSVGRAWGSRCGVGEARCGGTSPSPPPAVPGASWCWAAGCHGSHLPARWAALPWEPLPSLGAPLPQQPVPPLPPCGAGRGHGGGRGHVRLRADGWAANSPRCCPYRRAAGCSAGSLAPRHGVRTGFWGRYGAKNRQRGAGLSVPGSSNAAVPLRARRGPAGRRCRLSAAALCARSRVPASPRPGPKADPPAEPCRRTPGSPWLRCRVPALAAPPGWRPSPAPAPARPAARLRARRCHPAPPAVGRSLRGLAGRLPAAVGGAHGALRRVAPHRRAGRGREPRARLPRRLPPQPQPRSALAAHRRRRALVGSRAAGRAATFPATCGLCGGPTTSVGSSPARATSRLPSTGAPGVRP